MAILCLWVVKEKFFPVDIETDMAKKLKIMHFNANKLRHLKAKKSFLLLRDSHILVLLILIIKSIVGVIIFPIIKKDIFFLFLFYNNIYFLMANVKNKILFI